MLLVLAHVPAWGADLVPPPAAVPATPTIPPATLDETLSVSGETLAAREERSRLAVNVAVNGHGPYRFLVDSGADRTSIGAGLAQRLGLPSGGRAMLNDMVHRQEIATVRIDRLDLGRGRVPGIVAPELPETFMGAQGILGIDALADQRIMLDFERRQVTVQDARRDAPAEPGEIVVTARRRNGQLILTLTWVGLLRLYAIIDTGSEVTVGNRALLDRLTRAGRAGQEPPITLISVTGAAMAAQVATVPELRIGDLRLGNVPVAFADVPPFALFGLKDQPALLLGTDVLGAFARVSLDFRRRRVRFQPRG